MLPEKSRFLSDILTHSINLATAKGIASHNVKLLLSDVIGIAVPALTLHKDYQLTTEQLDLFNQWLKQLLLHKPVQYITGSAVFYGLKLFVNEYVLIPRPETEGLVEWIVKEHLGQEKVLDIGTGSGAIALALKKLNPDYDITALDVSAEAIKLAKRNAQRNSAKVAFIKGDIYPQNHEKFSIIVSNPPYIPSQDYYSLQVEVLCNEPKLALLAAQDGLYFYKKIISRAHKHLRDGGKIYLEIGETQADSIRDIAIQTGFKHCILKQDLAGKDRYLCIF